MPGQAVRPPIPRVCLKRLEVRDDEGVVWNADLLVSDLNELGLTAGVFRDARDGVVQP